MSATTEPPLARTPLHALHRERGAKMVPFAGYDMPVQYPTGVLAEHLHTRAQAGLFDVSHMGQVRIDGNDRTVALEGIVPGDICGLAPGRMRYTMFTDEAGGILDDIMVANAGDYLAIVVNAACKDADLAHMVAALTPRCTVAALTDRALLALQGPAAAAVLERLAPGATKLGFMAAQPLRVHGKPCFVTRSGYTGEDGFEIAVAAADAEALASALLAEPEVAPIGLGARDSLRLEAGLCLYGHDIDTTTTPIEAGLAWTIGRRRREEGGFPGARVIQQQLREGMARRRVGLRPADRAPAREGTEIVSGDGRTLGRVTSGGFGPSFGGPLAMGYVEAAAAAPGTALGLMIRGTRRAAEVCALPFVPHRYATR